ncbi:MAG: hypothetical protein GC136_06095 [Alphaproteobacteria bacterium]|nr:hypothetical protein [Alphaproteobacteria bacterium]
MDWLKLEPEKTNDLIEKIKSPADAVLFSPTTSDISRGHLPFYRTVGWYRLTNYAALPVFTIEFLSNGVNFFEHLDGTEVPIYATNAACAEHGEFQLNELTVLPYLNFFFMNVIFEDGDAYIVNPDEADPGRSRFVGGYMPYDLTAGTGYVSVKTEPSDGKFEVTAPMVYAGALVRAKIEVNNLGHVRIAERGLWEKDLSTALQAAVRASEANPMQFFEGKQ